MPDKKTKRLFNNCNQSSRQENNNCRKEESNFRNKRNSMPNKLDSSPNSIAKKWNKSWSPTRYCKKRKKWNIFTNKSKLTNGKGNCNKDKDYKPSKRKSKSSSSSSKEEMFDKTMKSSNFKPKKWCSKNYRPNNKIFLEFKNKDNKKWRKNTTKKLLKELTKRKT